MQRHRLINRLLGTAAWLVALSVVLRHARHGEHLRRPRTNPRCRPSTCSPCAGQQLQLTMRLSGAGPAAAVVHDRQPGAHLASTCRTPTLALPSRRIDVHAAGLDSILAAEAKDRTRLVLNLDKLVPYDTRVDGQQHHRDCSAAAASPAAAAAAAAPPTAGPRSAPRSGSGARELRASTSAAARTAPVA